MNTDIRTLTDLELGGLIMQCSAELQRRHSLIKPAAIATEMAISPEQVASPLPPFEETDLVGRFISDQLGVRIDTVVPSARLIEDLGADSLDLTELTMALEDSLGILLNDEQERFVADNIRTVDDVRRFVKSLC